MSWNTKLESGSEVQYVGLPGVTRECIDAVERILLYHDDIESASIYSFDQSHGIGMTVPINDRIVVKAGFSSGYRGGGSMGFSYVISLLESRNISIQEFDLSESNFIRLNSGTLTHGDIESIEKQMPVRPTRWHDYVFDRHQFFDQTGKVWQESKEIIPLSVIDIRIMDLALAFWKAPDTNLVQAYRRLEDIVRARIGSEKHGTRLFSDAFASDKSLLTWDDIDPSEQTGRCQLFTGAYQAHRNPRAHREQEHNKNEYLSELLLLNHLYLLESASVARDTGDDDIV